MYHLFALMVAVALCQQHKTTDSTTPPRLPRGFESRFASGIEFFRGGHSMRLADWVLLGSSKGQSRRAKQHMVAQFVDTLETKQLLSATIGPDGWTDIQPSSDSRIVYVSSSTGNDANDGLTPQTAKRSIQAGYNELRHGMPDHLLLKSGDSFDGGDQQILWVLKSGRSASEPLHIGSYGDGPRPVLNQVRVYIKNGQSNIAITNLDFYANRRDPGSPDYNPSLWIDAAIVGLGNSQNVLIEGNRIRYYGGGIQFQDNELSGKHAKNLSVRRNVIAYNYGGTHAQGLWMKDIDGLTVEENIFNHNGWLEGQNRSIFAHNTYLFEVNDLTFRGNVVANASSKGLNLPSDQVDGVTNVVIEDNLFVGNNLDLTLGRSGVGPLASGEFSHRNVQIQDNVFTHQSNWQTPQSLEFVNLKDATITRNLWLDNSNQVDTRSAVNSLPEPTWQQQNVEIDDNTLYRWDDETPFKGLYDLPATVSLHDNEVNQAAAAYADPTRDLPGYAASLGGAASIESFLQGGARLSRADWNEQFTAHAANEYLRQGFRTSAPTASLDANGLLKIHGDDQRDKFELHEDANGLSVKHFSWNQPEGDWNTTPSTVAIETSTDTVSSVPSASVSGIEIYSYAGDDWVSSYISGKSVTMDAGVGNDLMSADEVLHVVGGDGEDTFDASRMSNEIVEQIVTLESIEHTIEAPAPTALVVDNSSEIVSVVAEGSSADDVFEFDATNGRVRINNEEAEFTGTYTVRFEANGGNDQIVVIGSGDSEVVTVNPGRITVGGNSFTLDVVGVPTVLIESGGGSDSADIFDTPGDDSFNSSGEEATLTASNGEVVTLVGYEIVRANASTGNDVAEIGDSPGNDEFITNPGFSYLEGPAFYRSVEGFDTVTGHSTAGGTDTAELHGSDRSDFLTILDGGVSIATSGTTTTAYGFTSLAGYAVAGGRDRAIIHDTPGNDVLASYPNETVLKSGARKSSAVGFDMVISQAYNGGYDQVRFYDSDGNDLFVATTNYAYMRGIGYLNYARGFDMKVGIGAGRGTDQARLYDSAGDDQFGANANRAWLYNQNGFATQVSNFDSVQAYATRGGDDTARFYDTAQNDSGAGDQTQFMLTGVGYRNTARGFGRVIAYSRGGNDRVTISGNADDFFQSVGDWTIMEL